ncbi:MAG: GNAT family N-acetyltransferase, partial [Chloroflexota bacterium]
IRPITSDEVPAFLRIDSAGFFDTITDAAIERERPMLDLDHTLAAFDNGRIVATSGAYPFQITVPGPVRIPAAGVAWVAVLSTHRRQGLLRAMITRQLENARARGAPVSILYSSQSTIYGRFGYGIATYEAHYRIEQAHAAFARQVEPPSALTLVNAEEAAGLLPGLYAKAVDQVVGALGRDDRWWRRFLDAGGAAHDGTGARHYVIARDADGTPVGYATYRVKREWRDGIAESILTVGDCFAVTPQATASLWRFLTTQDLVGAVDTVSRPIEEPLRWLLADPRRLRTTQLGDGLWLRILDVRAALEARRYRATGRLVLEVADAVLPDLAGRYLLEASPEGARCTVTTAVPDLRLDIADLGAVYLGGTRPSLLAEAGRVVEEWPGALRLADMIFAAGRAPFCTVQF